MHSQTALTESSGRCAIRRGLLLVVSLLAACAVAAGAQQQAPPAGRMRLTKIEVVGLRRLKEEEIVAASGLRVGESLTVEDFDAAAQKLLASGLVTKVAYKLRERGGEATIVLEVVEAEGAGNLPVVFDNFVWFTPEEIAAAVKREVPAFDGTAPDSSLVIDGIKRALEGLLRERKIAATVEYMASANLDTGGERKHVFAARGVSVPVCALKFPGASGVAESELADAARRQSQLLADYSRELFASFAAGVLREIYQERGYLRVEFGAPVAALAGDCGANGVAVTVPVREGLAYNWGGATWAGNEALPSSDLTSALGMKPGELANGLKITRSLAAVSRAYGRKGYLAVRFKESPEFDDAARTVAYHFEVREGEQYRMGALVVAGLAEADAARVREKWAPKEGDVYDAGYVDAFVRQATMDVVRATGRPARVGVQTAPDARKKTVDVTLTFKGGS